MPPILKVRPKQGCAADVGILTSGRFLKEKTNEP